MLIINDQQVILRLKAIMKMGEFDVTLSPDGEVEIPHEDCVQIMVEWDIYSENTLTEESASDNSEDEIGIAA